MINGNNIGSEWRIWDLHVHSPASYGGDYSTFIKKINKCDAEVIGINDYHTINGYEEVIKLGGIVDKIVFPVVEFRMHNLISSKRNPNGVQINFHIIFDNDLSVLPIISTWMNSLKCFNEKGENVQLGTVKELSKISFDFEKVVDSLGEFNLLHKHALVWLPYDEYGGIDEIDPHNDGLFKLSLINKSHIIGSSTKKQIDFFKWEFDKFDVAQYAKWFNKPKPCIKGSDAHKIDYPFGQLMNAQSEPTDRYCWINAEMTFRGLKQIIVEPERVFIGDEPDLIKRVRINPTKFLTSLSVNKIRDAKIEDVWFKDFHLEFNSSLVAIIGHKGGGKSAITDILGICGNTHQDPKNFSFLNNQKFRKPKPYNLSEKFKATLLWKDGNISSKRLDENPDKISAERVKYIPQNFLESLCADIESEEFEEELKQIIFSHTPNEKRLGKTTLDELINYKSSLVNGEIAQIQTEISEINKGIVELEGKATKDYKQKITNLLELKNREIEAHNSTKPVEPKPGSESEESNKLIETLTSKRDQIKVLEDEIADLQDNKSKLLIKKEELTRSLQYYTNIDERLKKIQSENHEYVQLLIKYGIPLSDVLTFKIDTSKISALITTVATELLSIEKLISKEEKGSKTDLLLILNEELRTGQEVLSKPAKDKQKYLDDIKSWGVKLSNLIGSADLEGTQKFYESQLAYINEKLISDLKSEYSKRRILLEELFSKKLSLIEIRKELFQPVSQFINEFKELKQRYDINIDVGLELRSFSDNFFTFISQSRAGTFYGIEEGNKKLTNIINRADFSFQEGFISFLGEIISSLRHDKRNTESTESEVSSQLRSGIELPQLYDYIFNADYLQPVYSLKLSDKSIQELSPGERGALLLIFYLILDKDDIPLIIDQPEENLDNESVYHILVHFIKKVKEKRQIIIVTHNPNIAIVCDADQIINMQIEKANKNIVKFDSGAIENENINQAIVNILEGTMPAFDNRDSKYIR